MTPRSPGVCIDRKAVCVCGHRVTDHWYSTRTTACYIVAAHDCTKCHCKQFRATSSNVVAPTDGGGANG